MEIYAACEECGEFLNANTKITSDGECLIIFVSECKKCKSKSHYHEEDNFDSLERSLDERERVMSMNDARSYPYGT